MTRIDFLEQFLGALGAKSIVIIHECSESIEGRAFFENDPAASYFDPDDDQTQGFVWHRSAFNSPRRVACNIVSLLNKKLLLDIDKIKLSRKELYDNYVAEYAEIEHSKFTMGLEEILRIEVNMVDDGKETDIFFIHE
ncbi:hypothetical protein ACFL4M_01870 [Pseudomonadota bacterium]